MSEQQFEINKVYTKDISAEVPNAPRIFQSEWDPEIDLNLDNNFEELIEDELAEVTLTITVTATVDEKTAYVIEVEQAGIFTISGFEAEQKAYIVGAMVPNILFPYARETISSLSQKSGFPPLLLSPIDFHGLFQQHLEEAAADNSGEDTADTDDKTEEELATKH